MNFLYTANFFCDTSVASKAATGCEAGTTYNKLPPAATSQDPLYIPIPLGFTPSQGLQCPMMGNCIDHSPTMDMSALYPVLKPILGLTSASQLDNAPLSPHSHIIFNRNNNLPEWWNVIGVPVTSQTGFDTVIAATSQSQLTSDLGTPGVYTSFVPTNEFLYFQVLAGTSATTADAATNQGSYHGASGPATSNSATSVDPLAIPTNNGQQTSDCGAPSGATAPPPCAANDIGVTQGFYQGSTVNFLYSQSNFCDRSVWSQSPNGCEAGATYQNLPPGTASASQTDPLYIITPLFTPSPTGLQCPTTGYCIDHPTTVDLSRLASTLDPILGTTPSQLGDAPLSPHSHIVLTTNNYQPEWWNVQVIGVTSQAAYNQIITSSNEYATAQSLAASSGGVTMPIPTNIFLWFQVLPGTVPSAPAPGMPVTSSGSTTVTSNNSGDQDDTSSTSDQSSTMSNNSGSATVTSNNSGDQDDTSSTSDQSSTTSNNSSSAMVTTNNPLTATATSNNSGDQDDTSSTSDQSSTTSNNASTSGDASDASSGSALPASTPSPCWHHDHDSVVQAALSA